MSLTATRRALLVLAAAAITLLVPLAAAAPAHASDARPAVVVPQLNCVTVAADGSYAAVLGYTNSGSPVSIPLGEKNHLTGVPAGATQGTPPTAFRTGTFPGQFTVYMARGARGSWTVSGRTAAISPEHAVPCGNRVECPATGNGLGAALVALAALVAAGGIVLARRLRSRATR